MSQTYKKLEIILVNDCSSDGSARICDDWAKRDDRIKVIHKEKNEGQGIARNAAMNIAAGKYICFIDSDDYIDSDMAIGRLVETALKEQAEAVVFGIKNIAADGSITAGYVPRGGERVYRGAEVQEEFLPEFISPDPKGTGERLFYMSSCLLLYSMEKIREIGWKYVSERTIISEDVYSLLNLFDRIETVAVVPEDYYCYCENDNTSFSRKYDPDRYEKIRHFYLKTVKLCEEKGYGADIIGRVTEPYLSYTMSVLKQETKTPFPFKERWNKVYKIMSDSVLQHVAQQKKDDRAVWTRRLIYFLIRNKCYLACYLLVAIKK